MLSTSIKDCRDLPRPICRERRGGGGGGEVWRARGDKGCDDLAKKKCCEGLAVAAGQCTALFQESQIKLVCGRGGERGSARRRSGGAQEAEVLGTDRHMRAIK